MRKRLPKIRFVDEIPKDWKLDNRAKERGGVTLGRYFGPTDSDPVFRIFVLRTSRKDGEHPIAVLLHELIHWGLWLIGGRQKIQDWFDKKAWF